MLPGSVVSRGDQSCLVPGVSADSRSRSDPGCVPRRRAGRPGSPSVGAGDHPDRIHWTRQGSPEPDELPFCRGEQRAAADDGYVMDKTGIKLTHIPFNSKECRPRTGRRWSSNPGWFRHSHSVGTALGGNCLCRHIPRQLPTRIPRNDRSRQLADACAGASHALRQAAPAGVQRRGTIGRRGRCPEQPGLLVQEPFGVVFGRRSSCTNAVPTNGTTTRQRVRCVIMRLTTLLTAE